MPTLHGQVFFVHGVTKLRPLRRQPRPPARQVPRTADAPHGRCYSFGPGGGGPPAPSGGGGGAFSRCFRSMAAFLRCSQSAYVFFWLSSSSAAILVPLSSRIWFICVLRASRDS